MEASKQQYYQDRVQEAIHYLEAHAHEKILLEDIAHHACLSPFHFHRIFKIFTQETTKQYLTRLRLEKAAHLLRHSSIDIAQIASGVGYENHETFTRAFKNHFALAPVQYRQEAQVQIEQKQWNFLSKQIQLDTLKLELPQIQFIPPTTLAYIRHTGSYDDVGKTWNKLSLWAIKHWQIGRHTSTLGIVHDNPDITETNAVRYDACLVIQKELKAGSSDMRFKTLPGGKYAVFRYRGPYEQFYTVYDYIYSVCLLEFGYALRDEPTLEWYVKSPPFYRPENYITDFYVPIE